MCNTMLSGNRHSKAIPQDVNFTYDENITRAIKNHCLFFYTFCVKIQRTKIIDFCPFAFCLHGSD